MTNEKKLEAVISRAVENGWKPFGLLEVVLSGETRVGMRGFYHNLLGWNEHYIYLFDKGFAKAYFGERGICLQCGETDCFEEGNESWGKMWQYHLQQAVISDDPVSYYYKYL